MSCAQSLPTNGASLAIHKHALCLSFGSPSKHHDVRGLVTLQKPLKWMLRAVLLIPLWAGIFGSQPNKTKSFTEGYGYAIKVGDSKYHLYNRRNLSSK